MLEQIKVLNGMLALDQFTVAELAAFTDVKVSTVYTVLNRRESLLEPVGVESTGRPGGQSVRYRLKPEGIDSLRQEIGRVANAVALERQLSATAQAPSPPDPESSSLNVESAEEFLTYRMGKARNPAEKRSLLKAADTYLAAAQSEFDDGFASLDAPLARERGSRLKVLSALRDALDSRLNASNPATVAEQAASAAKPVAPPAPAVAYASAANSANVLRIGDVAPDFEADTTEGRRIRFHDWIGDSWVLLYAQPMDFLSVSMHGLQQLAKLKPEFDKRNTKILGISADPFDGRLKWLSYLKDTKGYVTDYPMIPDVNCRISTSYGMMPTDGLPLNLAATVRRTVSYALIVGPDKKIKLVLAYPLTTGLNFQEVLRVIDSLQMTAKHKVATPADWKQGEDVIITEPVSTEEARRRFAQGVSSGFPLFQMARPPHG